MIQSQATLLEKQVSPNGLVSYLLFETETKIPFEEGQFMMLECLLRSGEVRKKPYSIATPASLMEESQLIGFYIKQERIWGCSEYLTQDIQCGETLILKGPVGYYLDHKKHKNYLFLSTWSGLAPNLSLLRKLGNEKSYEKIAFLFGERDEWYMLAWVEETMKFGIQQNSEREFFKLCYSTPHKSLADYAVQWYIQTQIQSALLFLWTTDISVFLCGKPQMVDESIGLLLSLGIERKNIILEKY